MSPPSASASFGNLAHQASSTADDFAVSGATVRSVESASEEQLDRATPVLLNLARRHGLSSLRHAGPGLLVADVANGRTYFDIARFELEAEAVLRAAVHVVSSGADAAPAIAGRELGGVGV